MRAGRLSVRGAMSVGLAISASACFAVSARAATPLPPDLVALEQQMGQLQVATERMSIQMEMTAGGLFGQEIPFVLIFAGVGEGGDAPEQAEISGGVLGLTKQAEQTRVIGGTLYRYEPQAGRIDGGRPWVARPRRPKEQPVLAPNAMLEPAQPGPQGTFTSLIEQVNGALSVQESGPVTVDDQRVIEFDAKLDPAPLLAKLRSEGHDPGQPLELSGPSPRHGKPLVEAVTPPTLELELFVAPNGLPVRTRVTFVDKNMRLAVRVDLLAINIPVHVAPPPADKTISQARLEKLERRRAERRAARVCAHVPGGHTARCRRRIVRSSGSSHSGSEGSLF